MKTHRYCDWCANELTQKELTHLYKTNECLCYPCFEKLKDIIEQAGFKVDRGEQYP